MVERSRRWSLRRRFALLGLAGLVLISGLGVWLTWAYRDAREAARTAAGLQPLSAQARDLSFQFVDADGWVSNAVIQGAVAQGDAASVAKADEALAAAATSLRALAAGGRDTPGVPELVSRAASSFADWRATDADPTLAAMRVGDVRRAAVTTSSPIANASYTRAAVDIQSLQEAIESRQRVSEVLLDGFGVQLRNALLAAVVLMLGFLVAAYLLLRRWVRRPLEDLGEQMAAVARDGRHTRRITPVGPAEIVALSQSADHMRDKLVEQIRLTGEAETALRAEQPTMAELRGALEPTSGPTPGLRIHGGVISRADEGVAGDLFDSVLLDDGTVALLLADVSGHGQSAGLVALRTKLIARRALLAGQGPAAVMAELQSMFDDQPDRFCTCVVVVVDPRAGSVVWANAGHHAPLLLRDDDGDGRPDPGESADRLEATGPLLSALGGSWSARSTTLGVGDVLLMWSDGLVEGRDPGGAEIGETGLLAVIDDARRGRGATDVRADPDALIRLVRQSVRESLGEAEWRRDDVTLVAVTREPGPGPGVRLPAARRPG